MQSVLLSAVTSLVVALAVSFAAPRFNFGIWKKQKLREQQLSIAERFAKLGADMYVYSNVLPRVAKDHEDAKRFVEAMAPMLEQRALVGLMSVLFDNEELWLLGTELGEIYDSGDEEGAKRIPEIRGRMMEMMYAEALEISSRKLAKRMAVPIGVAGRTK
jgi:hypothetical protein